MIVNSALVTGKNPAHLHPVNLASSLRCCPAGSGTPLPTPPPARSRISNTYSHTMHSPKPPARVLDKISGFLRPFRAPGWGGWARDPGLRSFLVCPGLRCVAPSGLPDLRPLISDLRPLISDLRPLISDLRPPPPITIYKCLPFRYTGASGPVPTKEPVVWE